MRVLIWNLNHRAARRRMPEWIAAATSPWAADVVVLTEYVEGPDHDRFLRELDVQGLQHSAQTESRKGQNQVLIASRVPSRRGHLVAPTFHDSVPPNALHVVLEESRMAAKAQVEQSGRPGRWRCRGLLRSGSQSRHRPSLLGRVRAGP